MHQQEANRLQTAANQPGMIASIKGPMQWLQDSIKALESQIDELIDGHPKRRADAELIISIPGLRNTTLDSTQRQSNGHRPDCARAMTFF